MTILTFLVHPREYTYHSPIKLGGGPRISVSVTACGANLPGDPPAWGERRQGFHGGFDVENVERDRMGPFKFCRRCFPRGEKARRHDAA